MKKRSCVTVQPRRWSMSLVRRVVVCDTVALAPRRMPVRAHASASSPIRGVVRMPDPEVPA